MRALTQQRTVIDAANKTTKYFASQVSTVYMYYILENHRVITASTPIIMTEDGNEAAVAVVGAQLRYSKFFDLFMNTTQLCSNSGNEVLCHDLCHNDVSKLHYFLYVLNPSLYDYKRSALLCYVVR